MADVKISNLPASSTPLAGTEVLPVVQSGTTVQVSVANLTAGRAIGATNATFTGALNVTPTWNAGATVFTGIGMNVTDTASAAGSLLLDLQVGGASQFKVSKAGAATTNTIELGHANDTTLARASAGVVTIEGVEITTNSATQTLSNKTLSSPTLSGTVAGSPTFSGELVMAGSLYPIRIEDGAYLRFYNGSTGSNFALGKPNANDLYFYNNANPALVIFADRGVVVAGAAGGSQGAGTLNATAVYDDGVLLTCYVLEHWVTGSIDLNAWDARVPNREIPAVVVDDQETEPARIEVRQHLPAQGFAAVADERLDIDQFRQFLVENSRLPAFPGPDRWADMFNGKMATGDVLQRLWETVEVLAVHVCKAREREIALEARISALENVS
jgi:hypothetical protein